MGHGGSTSDYIEENPYQPGAADARLKGYGVPVWALVGYLPAAGRITKLAIDYDLPEHVVHAALDYYFQHRCEIDERIAANEIPVSQAGDA